MLRKHGPVDLCKVVVLLFHVVYVQATIQCARTQDEWNKASASLQCQEPNYYHCLKNENGNFTQQCLQRVWIQNGMCPEFNTRVRRIDVFQCQSDENCPNTIYWSNAVYLYPICYDKITPETKESTTLSSTETVSIENSAGNMNQNNRNLTTILAIVLPLVVLIAIVFIVFCLRRRKNRESNTDIVQRRKEDKSQTEGLEENMKMLDSSVGGKQLREESSTEEDHICTRYEKRDYSKSTNVAKKLDDLISEVERTKSGFYILVLLYRSKMPNDSYDIKENAENILGTAVNLQNDYQKWINSKTESSYVFKDWITSNKDFDINKMRTTLVDILQAIKTNETKFVLVFPLSVWSQNANLSKIGELKICRQKTISLMPM